MEISWDLDRYVGAFNFRLTIDGIPQENAKVLAVSGVSSESKLVDDNTTGRKPLVGGGQITLSEVEITRVYQGYDQFYNWRLMIEEGMSALRSVSIELLAPDLTTVVRKVTLHNCWPNKWQMPNLDASSTAPAIETISLAYERMTGGLGSVSIDDAYAHEGGTANGTGPLTNSTASGATLEDKAFNDDFWDKASDLTALKDKYDAALELASQAGELFDPSADEWEPPGEFDGIAGAGGQAENDFRENDTTAFSGEATQFADTGGGEGPIGGRGEAAEAEYGEGEGPIGGRGEAAEAEYGEGDGVDYVGSGASGETMAFEDTGGGDGAQVVNEFAASGAAAADREITDWGGSVAADDPTAAMQGGDGTGPTIVGNAAGVQQDFADTSDDGKPIDPNEESWDSPDAVDDPTAGKNGGDGGGPLGGRGAAAEADYGAPGTGPKGGRGEGSGGQTE